MHFSDSPVLWIRLDPEITLLRSTNIEQPDYQWQYQLRHERDVIAQIEAIASLERYPTPATRLALTDTIENEGTYYKVNIDFPPPEFRIFFCTVLIVCFSVKVRCKAAHCLTKVANAMIANWAGPPAMLTIFRKLFGSFSCPHIMKQNNFQNFQHYYLQKVIPPSFFFTMSMRKILVFTTKITFFRPYRSRWRGFVTFTEFVLLTSLDFFSIYSNTTTTAKIYFPTIITERV